jgi:hypothetical protein
MSINRDDSLESNSDVEHRSSIKSGDKDLHQELVLAELNQLTGKTKDAVLKYSENVDKKVLSPEQKERLFSTLKARFEQKMERHQGIEWSQVEERLKNAESNKLWSLNEMEKTGGEPDVVGFDKKTGEVIFYDCSEESPIGRRNIVYDREAEENVKESRPIKRVNGNAVDTMEKMGIELLDEAEYRFLQTLGEFDTDVKESWSWLKTPNGKRKEGVALLGHRWAAVKSNNFVVAVYEADPNDHEMNRGVRGKLRV